MQEDTKLVHAGRDPDRFHGAVNVPVYHASTILFPNMAALEAAEAAKRRGEQVIDYGRNGTPTVFAFENTVAALEGGHAAASFPSGVAAISASILACVKAGDHVLIVDCAYGPTRIFAEGMLRRFGVEVEYFDPAIGAGIGALMRPNTSVVFLEAPGSHTFEMQDVPAIAAVARQRGARVLIDNTWATPLFFKPLAQGANISIHSATKYIVGHADALLGVAICDEDTWPLLKAQRYQLGECAGPDDIYLALRGLRTLGVRLPRHQQAGLAMAEWLRARPEVRQVLHPGLPGAPGHDLWKRDFTGACGLFAIELQPAPAKAADAFVDALELFGLGASWGGFESLVLPGRVQRYRTVTPWRFEGQLMRIHIGLEALDDLKADLERGFAAYRAAA